MSKIKGQCLCGAVQFEVQKPDYIDACHCTMCQKWNGGPWLSTSFISNFNLEKSADLTWYDSSKWARRGFCSKCGSNLFYQLKEEAEKLVVSAGVLDLPEGFRLAKEIFIEDKPDYYDFNGQQKRMTGAEVLADYGAKS